MHSESDFKDYLINFYLIKFLPIKITSFFLSTTNQISVAVGDEKVKAYYLTNRICETWMYCGWGPNELLHYYILPVEGALYQQLSCYGSLFLGINPEHKVRDMSVALERDWGSGQFSGDTYWHGCLTSPLLTGWGVAFYLNITISITQAFKLVDL